MPTPIDNIRREFFGKSDPYAGTDLRYVDHSFPHTNLTQPAIVAVLRLTKPAFWLEIGSYIGGSAIRTARNIKRLEFPTQIVCMDPFCGGTIMWNQEATRTARGERSFLQLENGRPTIWEQFRANVVEAGMQDIIVPFPVTSMVGIALLLGLPKDRVQLRPEVIYLDSAHQADETFLELRAAWQLLVAGGILFGDDWNWNAVRADATRFAETVQQNDAHLTSLTDALPGAALQGRVLVWQNQWFMAKGG